MMRVVEHKMITALLGRKNCRSGNDRVVVDGEVIRWYYHGNLIVEWYGESLYLRDCGWRTTTTKSRLNAMLSAVMSPSRITQHKWAWYVDGDKWFGSMAVYIGHLYPATCCVS